MAEFDEKLNALLSNPESMAQIMQLAQSLSGSAPETPQEGGAPPPRPAGPPPRQPEEGPASASGSGAPPLGSLLGSLDPKLLARLLPVLGELGQQQSSEASALLYALRPYLKPARQEKVERALQLARLIHIGKKFLAGWEG